MGTFGECRGLDIGARLLACCGQVVCESLVATAIEMCHESVVFGARGEGAGGDNYDWFRHCIDAG